MPLLVQEGKISREADYSAPIGPSLRPNGKNPLWDDWTALMVLAATNTDPACFDALVDQNFDPLAANPFGVNALMAAICFNPNIQMATACLRHGIPIDSRDGLGMTPICWFAMGLGTVRHLNLLVRNGGNVNDRAKGGNTPVSFAAGRKKRAWIIRHLARFGADVNAKNDQGQTPLMLAVLDGRVSNALALIGCGADLGSRDKNHLDAGAYYLSYLEAGKKRHAAPRLAKYLDMEGD